MQQIKVDKNVEIAVLDINPNEKSGNNKDQKTVLFIHGWPLNHTIFEYQFNALRQKGVRCIAMDLRGFGKSSTPFDGYSYDQMTKDIHQVIKELDLENITLAGFSMGGALAIRYMSKFDGYGVNRLALLGAAAPCFTSSAGFTHGMKKEQVDALILQTCVDRPKMVSDFGNLVFASNPSQSFKDWFKQIGLTASSTATIQTAISLRDEDLRDDLKNIKVPTAIFHGKLDKICPHAFAEEMNSGIKGSKIVSFEKSGHAVFYDELNTFNCAFTEFVCNS